MQKNQADQKLRVYVYSTYDGEPVTGDVANLTLHWWDDDGYVDELTNAPTESDATRLPGWYEVELTAAETNAEHPTYTAVSATEHAVCDGVAMHTHSDVLHGTGARTVTITVDDGTDALATALVRLTLSGQTLYATTDSSGEVVFGVDDGTWSVAITRLGHTFTPTTLAVSDDTEITYSMTKLTTTAPARAGQTVGYLYCSNADDTEYESGVLVTVECLRPPTAYDGVAISTAVTDTSDATGLVEFQLWKTARYRYRVGDGIWFVVDIASDAGDTLALDSIHAVEDD